MKYAAALAALAASAIAAPSVTSESDKRDNRETCKFGTYRCTTPNTGIEICNIAGYWELVGPCPYGTECTNLPQNGFTLPFCTNVEKPTKHSTRNGRPGQSPGEHCATPGKYQCFGPYAIQVCNVQNVLEKVGDCPHGSHCDYISGIPYCVANY